ncbi:MAG: hypothetical protein R2762_09625 [Bryobacteraceae bacterium]
MMKTFAAALLVCVSAMASYKAEPAGAPPSELDPAIAAALEAKGTKVVAEDGKTLCEIWWRKEVPKGPESHEADMMWKTTPMFSVIGAIRYPEEGADRRGQKLKAGVYTLRFALFPINGDHQGVSPNRDFLILTPAADDKTLDPPAKFDDLMKMSRKASGTPHPAVLSMWIVEGDFTPGMQEIGEDQALFAKVNGTQLGVILVGTAE